MKTNSKRILIYLGLSELFRIFLPRRETKKANRKKGKKLGRGKTCANLVIKITAWNFISCELNKSVLHNKF